MNDFQYEMQSERDQEERMMFLEMEEEMRKVEMLKALQEHED